MYRGRIRGVTTHVNARTHETTPFLAPLSERRAHVVIVRALRLGDLLCAVPALRALRAALRQAQFTLIGLPLAREFVLRCRYVDDFEEFPGYPGIADQPIAVERTVAFLRRMQGRHIDLAVQLHGSGVFSNPFTRLLGAHQTVGFTRAGETDLGLDYALPYPSTGSEVQRLLRLTRALGAPDVGDHLEFAILPQDDADLDEALLRAHPGTHNLFARSQPVIGLHPGAKIPTRRWMPARFAAVGDALAARYHAAIVLTGSAAEWDICEAVRQRMRAPAVNLAGCTSLGPLAALIARLRLLVSNDSGPAHLAAAVGTRSVVIFGAAQPETWASGDPSRHRAVSAWVPCRPCAYIECPIGYACLEGVGVADVLRAAQDVLDFGLAPLTSAEEGERG